MYMMIEKEETVRVPPEKLNEKLDETAEELTKENFEGMMANGAFTLLITNVKGVGDGKVVHGDGGVYQKVSFNALVLKPEMQEIIEGSVCEALSFGAFIRFGPLDGLVHISQILDDRINFDSGNQRLIGKVGKKELKVGDSVKARIVTLSLNEINPRESRIGLTMRQSGLGKLEWIEESRKKEGEKKAGKEEKKAGKEEKKVKK
ncbi:MAG: DNA-directed RNA polymerase [Thermoplasmatales archaeon]|nr:DNA-directed RNA polymerase [Candidatus Thermoplasmatota archaeon]MCG2825059.1 DNA-directed RNA polymerase [Thermoplasmatales archaeon]